MELFSEIYSAYYRAIERVLIDASDKPVSIQDVQRILSENSFSESFYHILPKLKNGDWPLLRDTGNGYVSASASALPAENPLTNLQKAWLLSILEDPRINLFLGQEEITKLYQALNDVVPLFYQEDFYPFDRAKDGDNYESPQYRIHFKAFLRAIRHKSAVSVQYEGGKGNRVNGVFWPYKLEYSDKDDKFRALCYLKAGPRKKHYTLNLGRVISTQEAEVQQNIVPLQDETPKARFRTVTIEIKKERNALERCMVQFAHFEKRTEYDADTGHYTCAIKYNAMDETEMIIRILSFGSTVKVLGPDSFIEEIRSRLRRQNELIKGAVI